MQPDACSPPGRLWREQYKWYYLDTYISSDIPTSVDTYHTTFVADRRNGRHDRLFG